ncbi:hypothetical protein OKW38_007205 [Paraburkholderia sp. MM5496-R1]
MLFRANVTTETTTQTKARGLSDRLPQADGDNDTTSFRTTTNRLHGSLDGINVSPHARPDLLTNAPHHDNASQCSLEVAPFRGLLNLRQVKFCKRHVDFLR